MWILKIILPGQNNQANLEDANGRAVWALGYVLSEKRQLPERISSEAIAIFKKVIPSYRKDTFPQGNGLLP